MIAFQNFSQKTFLLLNDWLQNLTINKSLNFLLKSQYWNKAQIKKFQEERLKNLIVHASMHVPYYRDVFSKLKIKPSDFKTISDLKKLPILTKAEIKKHPLEYFKSENYGPKSYFINSSSGSTGEPLHYINDKVAYSINIAANLRGWYWMGYRLGDKFVKMSQYPRSENIKKIQDFFTNNVFIAIDDLDNIGYSRIVEEINFAKPKILRCYPDPLFFICKYLEKNNIKIHSPYAITTTGNVLMPEVRELIQRVFKAPVFDSYSCEGSAVFFNCSSNGKYHGSEETSIVELIDKNGNDVSGGESGRHITTNLWNYAMPFIRYDTQDFLIRSEHQCQCKRALIAIDKIEGRQSDILIGANGKKFIVHNFTTYFTRRDLEVFNTVEQFQIVQKSLELFEFRLIVNDNFNESVSQSIKKYWEREFGNGVTVKILQVNDIPTLESGKRRFLIRDNNLSLEY